MRAFNLNTPTITPSYENAIQAGGLSHTGNSGRPIGAPVKWASNPRVVQPPSYSGSSVPRANPVRVTSGVNGSSIAYRGPSHPIANPVAVSQNIRGTLGQ